MEKQTSTAQAAGKDIRDRPVAVSPLPSDRSMFVQNVWS